MIIDQLKKELKKSILNKEETKKNLIRVIIGEAELEAKKPGKDVNDDNMITSILKSMMDNAEQMGDQEEIDIIKMFMPIMLTEEQISSEIDKLIEENNFSSMRDLGNIMSSLKSQFGSTYDGKIASSIAKEKLGFNAIKIK